MLSKIARYVNNTLKMYIKNKNSQIMNLHIYIYLKHTYTHRHTQAKEWLTKKIRIDLSLGEEGRYHLGRSHGGFLKYR